MDKPISRLSYKLVSIPNPEKFSGYSTAIEISNPTDFSAFDVECEVLLLGSFGYDIHHFETEIITEIKPHGKEHIQYGDWTDFDMCFFAIRYWHLGSTEDQAQLELANQKVQLLLQRIQNPEAEKDWKDSFAQMSKGSLHIDGVSFLIDGLTLLDEIPIEPETVVPIPPFFVERIIREYWYNYLPVEKISSVISYFKSNTILVLGQYSGEGIDRMNSIALNLRNLEYDPVMLKDLPDHPSQSLEEKLLSVALLSRFVVVDDTEPSGHIDEIALLARSRVITVLLHFEGRSPTFMQADYPIDFSYINSWSYDNSKLPSIIDEATKWAEETRHRRTSAFRKTFPWR